MQALAIVKSYYTMSLAGVVTALVAAIVLQHLSVGDGARADGAEQQKSESRPTDSKSQAASPPFKADKIIAGRSRSTSAEDIDGEPALAVFGNARVAGTLQIGPRKESSEATVSIDGATGKLTAKDIFSLGGLHAMGSKTFVIPHPTLSDKQLVFAAIEGPEVAVYTRGTAKLTKGISSFQLPEEFGLVADEASITATITPLGRAIVWVESKSVSSIRCGSDCDVSIDFRVEAKRKGFTDFVPVQPRDPRLGK